MLSQVLLQRFSAKWMTQTDQTHTYSNSHPSAPCSANAASTQKRKRGHDSIRPSQRLANEPLTLIPTNLVGDGQPPAPPWPSRFGHLALIPPFPPKNSSQS